MEKQEVKVPNEDIVNNDKDKPGGRLLSVRNFPDRLALNRHDSVLKFWLYDYSLYHSARPDFSGDQL